MNKYIFIYLAYRSIKPFIMINKSYSTVIMSNSGNYYTV